MPNKRSHIFTLPALALFCSVETTHSAPSLQPEVLSARLFGLRNKGGMVGCRLYASKDGFPKKSKSARQSKWCSIHDGASICRFEPIPSGTYAVVCFHDENGDKKLNTYIFGIPKEGVVASNHAKGGMGPPSFEDAKFSYGGGSHQLGLKMDYF